MRSATFLAWPTILQTVEQDGELVALHSCDEIVVARAGHRSGNPQARFQAPGDGREQRVAARAGRSLAWARGSSDIDEQHREVKGAVAADPLDGVSHAIEQQEAIG